jgi:hypothetical protein
MLKQHGAGAPYIGKAWEVVNPGKQTAEVEITKAKSEAG